MKATGATSQQLVHSKDGSISVVDGALSDEGNGCGSPRPR